MLGVKQYTGRHAHTRENTRETAGVPQGSVRGPLYITQQHFHIKLHLAVYGNILYRISVLPESDITAHARPSVLNKQYVVNANFVSISIIQVFMANIFLMKKKKSLILISVDL